MQPKRIAPFLDDISSFGITLSDDIDGPFSLEIEYVGLEIDLGHDEECAYESYQTPRYDT